MVAQPNRRAVDGENELVTLTSFEPRFLGKNHMHPDCWVGKGELFGEPIHLLIRNTREHRDRFLKAGYVPADLFKNVEVKTNVTVLTAYDGHNLIIGDVLPATETVLSATERDAAWKLDVAMFGKPVVVGETATFARMGDSVVWTKDASKRYLRTWGTVVTVYEAKAQVSDVERVTAILARYGITPARPVVEVTSRTMKRPGPQPSWLVIRERNAPIPPGLVTEFQSMYVDGCKLIVQLRAS